MKQVFTIALFLSSFNAGAQKLHFTDSANHWVTKGYGADCISFYREYLWGRDTIIHGLKYVEMVSGVMYNPISCTGMTIHSLDSFFIREDTLARKVYYINYNIAYSPDTLEHVLYDYNLQPGDTIQYKTGTARITDSVTSIDSVLIAGVYHKVIYMQNKTGMGVAYYTIVEGIGCTASPLLQTVFIACFEYEEKLICYSKGSFYPVLKLPVPYLCQYSDSGYGLLNDTFKNSVNCTVLETSTTPVTQRRIVCSPNPASDQLNIAVGGSLEHTISVFDYTGRRVFQATLNSNSNALAINTALWNPGCYLVAVLSPDGALLNEKVMIRR